MNRTTSAVKMGPSIIRHQACLRPMQKPIQNREDTSPASIVGGSTWGDLRGPGGNGTRITAAPIGGGDKPIRGGLNAAIARAVVRIHRNRLGRGPTRARAFFRGDIVVVVLEDVLVTEERTLVAGGHHDSVILVRQRLLETMRPELITAVERLTGRCVTALMSDTRPKPDMASHVFVLDRPVETRPAGSLGIRTSRPAPRP
jgi:uncharacterized protein YbcI